MLCLAVWSTNGLICSVTVDGERKWFCQELVMVVFPYPFTQLDLCVVGIPEQLRRDVQIKHDKWLEAGLTFIRNFYTVHCS